MKALIVWAVLAAGPAMDEQAVGALTFRTPHGWSAATAEGTRSWKSPTGDAYFEIDTGEVQSKGMTGAVCLEKITKSLGGRFEPRRFGGQPAAVKTERTPDSAGKQFFTATFVGCDGRYTWSVTHHYVGEKAMALKAVGERVAESVAFPKAGAK